MKIEASILSADFWRLGEQVQALEQAGVDRLHVDVMDGIFVPNISIGLPVVESLQRHTDLPLAVHLMIEQPARYAKQFVEAGADLVWVHQEACPHLHRDLQGLRELGVKAGVSLNPGTPVATIAELLPDLDSVLVMSVNPGFGGQRFITSALRRIGQLRELIERDRLEVEIAVDGGVNEETAADVLSAGADTLVIGSALFRHRGGPGAVIDAVRRSKL